MKWSVDGMSTLRLTSDCRAVDGRQSFAFDAVIGEICGMRWESIRADEMIQVAKAYYFFSIQFRENLEIACRLYPNDQMLKQLCEGECDTDNLSPWPGIAAVGEKLNHDEFVRRLLSLQAIDRDDYLTGVGLTYLDRVRNLDDLIRATSIASYEDGGLSRVFQAILRARDWEGAGSQAFRFFLEQHIRFDEDAVGGHGVLTRQLRPHDDILLLWAAFRDILVAAVPKLAQTPTADLRRKRLSPDTGASSA
jgi:hypothetical protein